MAEQVTLATSAPAPYYRVSRLDLDWDGRLILVHLRGAFQETRTFSYSGTEAETLLRALNTANLSTKSLHRRILEKLTADGLLSGTVEGTPS